MKRKKPNSLEMLWFATAILCFFAAVHQTYYEGFSKSYVLFIFTLLAVAMYFLRKQLRKSNNSNKPNE